MIHPADHQEVGTHQDGGSGAWGVGGDAAAVRILAKLDSNDAKVVNGVQPLQSLYKLRRSDADLSQRLLSPEVFTALEDHTPTPASAEVAKLLDLKGTQIVPALRALDVVSEP
jgi:hypothetical protein